MILKFLNSTVDGSELRRENHRLDGAKTLVNNGISTTFPGPTGEFTGFLVAINSISRTNPFQKSVSYNNKPPTLTHQIPPWPLSPDLMSVQK